MSAVAAKGGKAMHKSCIPDCLQSRSYDIFAMNTPPLVLVRKCFEVVGEVALGSCDVWP